MQNSILRIYQEAKVQLENEKSKAIEDAKIEAQTQFIEPKNEELEARKQNEISRIDQSYENQKRVYKEGLIRQVEEKVSKHFDDAISDIQKKIESEGQEA